MFITPLLFDCLSKGLRKKLLNGLLRNLAGGWKMGQERNHRTELGSEISFSPSLAL